MKQALELARAMHDSPAKTSRTPRRRGVLWLCLAAWTVFVAVALWWLLRGDSGPAVYIFHEGDSAQHPALENFRAWFKADLGVQRAYPWVLLGPYVGLVALYFPLERGRLRLNLTLNLAACAGFVAASHAISQRTSTKGGTVVVLRSEGKVVWDGEAYHTNTVRTEMVVGAEDRETGMSTDGGGIAAFAGPGDLVSRRKMERLRDASAEGISNAFAQIRRGMRPAMPGPGLPRLGLLSMLLDLLAYSAVVGLAHSVHFYQRFREREHQALLLESSLAQARLNALRAQLQPHFLFNSLNAIAALLRRDAALAEATLLSLSDLLRLALSQSARQEVSLREEMNLVRRYLEIQQTRFGEKLRVEQDIEPAALDCLVPTLLLQPLVENAIRHGIEPADHPGLVRLTARRHDGRLVLGVEDNGVGLPNGSIAPPSNSLGPARLPAATGGTLATAAGGTGTGIGLANLRARLETLYGGRYSFELGPGRDGGVAIHIEIPWEPRMDANSRD